MSREGKLAKSTLILSIGTFLPKLASFVTLPILSGYLTKPEYQLQVREEIYLSSSLDLF